MNKKLNGVIQLFISEKLPLLNFLFQKRTRTCPKRRVSIFAFSLQKNKWKSHVFERKEKKCLEERNGECDRRGGKSSIFIVKKARISVQFSYIWTHYAPVLNVIRSTKYQ